MDNLLHFLNSIINIIVNDNNDDVVINQRITKEVDKEDDPRKRFR